MHQQYKRPFHITGSIHFENIAKWNLNEIYRDFLFLMSYMHVSDESLTFTLYIYYLYFMLMCKARQINKCLLSVLSVFPLNVFLHFN